MNTNTIINNFLLNESIKWKTADHKNKTHKNCDYWVDHPDLYKFKKVVYNFLNSNPEKTKILRTHEFTLGLEMPCYIINWHGRSHSDEPYNVLEEIINRIFSEATKIGYKKMKGKYDGYETYTKGMLSLEYDGDNDSGVIILTTNDKSELEKIENEYYKKGE